jgi:hypothetical protein
MNISKRSLRATSLSVSLIIFIVPAFSAELMHVELNKLESQNSACLAYLVFENNTGHSFSDLTLDLVMFDKQGIIINRLAVNAAPVAAEKTSVKLFDIEDLACEEIGSILLNGVLDCRDEGGKVPNCVALLSPSSRANVALEK